MNWIVFITGVGTLLGQLAHTRILAYVLWNHLVYLTITMAFCGFALAGTFHALWPKFFQGSEKRAMAWMSLGLALSLFLTLFLIAYLPLHTPETLASLSSLGMFFLANTLLILPYFFFGYLLSYALARNPEKSNRLYGTNLLGSGLGCLLFVYLLTTKPLGFLPYLSGADIILLLAVVFAGTALVFFLRERIRLGALASGVTLFLVAGILIQGSERIFPLTPESRKDIHYMCQSKGDRHVEFSRWNPLSRLDVIRCGSRPDRRYITYDGAAWSGMTFNKKGPDQIAQEVPSLPLPKNKFAYALRPAPENTFIIGVGGGRDVLASLEMGSKNVTAVEIHGVTTGLLKKEYGRDLGHVFDWPNVNLVHEDGRSYIGRTKKQFDVILMVGIDSFTALSSGAYVLYESYIYTQDALEDYIRHLNPQGVISISRWLFLDQPRESLRLFATAFAALKRLGVRRPLDHIAVVADKMQTVSTATLLVTKNPLTLKAITNLEEKIDVKKQAIIFAPDRTTSSWPGSETFFALAKSLDAGQEDTFFANYPYKISPVSDDSPFFFQYTAPSSLTQFLTGKVSDYRMIVQGNWTWIVMFSIFLQTMVLVILILLLPLRRTAWSAVPRRYLLNTSLVFGALGFGYTCLQTALIQKLILFLTHPIYAIAVVIPSLLIGAGIGAQISGRSRDPVRVVRQALWGIPALILIYAVFLTPLVRLASNHLGITGRAVLVSIVLLPIGFTLGIPFANGLRLISQKGERLVPWAFALNGAMSVMGSSLAVLLAVLFNFSFVLGLSALVYGVAALSWQMNTNAS